MSNRIKFILGTSIVIMLIGSFFVSMTTQKAWYKQWTSFATGKVVHVERLSSNEYYKVTILPMRTEKTLCIKARTFVDSPRVPAVEDWIEVRELHAIPNCWVNGAKEYWEYYLKFIEAPENF